MANLSHEQINEQVVALSGMTDAQFKAFLKKASEAELEEVRAENKRWGNEEVHFDNKRVAREFSRRAYQCKMQILKLREKGEQG